MLVIKKKQIMTAQPLNGSFGTTERKIKLCKLPYEAYDRRYFHYFGRLCLCSIYLQSMEYSIVGCNIVVN